MGLFECEVTHTFLMSHFKGFHLPEAHMDG